MNPKRRVPSGVWVLASLITLVVAPVAHAQFYDDARRSLGLGPDPTSRSPRLLGMGRLGLVVDDIHHRYDVWEYAANPAGLLGADSTSSLEFYPATANHSAVHDDGSSGTTRQVQDFALHEMRTGYEMWRRTAAGNAFGLMGEYGRLRTDSPLAPGSETRTQFSTPRTALVISGHMPLILSNKLRYGITFTHRYQTRDDEPHSIVSNAAGDWIDKDGSALTATSSFTPDHYGIRSVGARAGLMYRVAGVDLAGGYDYVSNAIEGRNDAIRTASEVRENRPYGTWSLTAASRRGPLSFVGDARTWRTGRTDQRWFATLSTGTGAVPVTGRGLYQRREETGHEYSGRVGWTAGSLTLTAGGDTWRREAKTLVPPFDDRTSFNYFLDQISGRPGADTLSLPDSLRNNATTETGDEFGFGASFHLPWRAMLAGAEYHHEGGTFDQLLSGPGPERSAWDVRGGVEVPINSRLAVRGGYQYRKYDTDANTEQNEYLSQAVSAGLGYMPLRSHWGVDVGYQVRWTRADFGDPTRFRSNDQAGLARLRWVF